MNVMLLGVGGRPKERLRGEVGWGREIVVYSGCWDGDEGSEEEEED